MVDFVQNKESFLLFELELFKGCFFYSVFDKVCWEYFEFLLVEMMIFGEEMMIWYKDFECVDCVFIGMVLEQVFKYMGVSGFFEMLMKYFLVIVEFFELEGELYYFFFLFKYLCIKKCFELMELWIDVEKYMLSCLSYVEVGGDIIELIFFDFEMNFELLVDVFEFDFLEGIEIKNVVLCGCN